MRVLDFFIVNILFELLYLFLFCSFFRIEIEFVYLFVCFFLRVLKCKFLFFIEFVSDDFFNCILIVLLIESFCLEFCFF